MRIRTESKREEILTTAARAFLELGFERTSMSDIAARLGGSKATLYGYFASKEDLFLAVAVAAGQRQALPALEDLKESLDDLRIALQRFGEVLLRFLLERETLAARRMVLAESQRSDIGQRFYLSGRQKGLELLAQVLEQAMDAERLRRCDPFVAATHLLGLIECELLPRYLFGVEKASPTAARIADVTRRAIAVFLAAYGPRAAKARAARSS